MFCENCGQKLTDGALFCEYCGKKIEVMPTVQQPQTEQRSQTGQLSQPVQQAQAVQQSQAMYAAQPQYQPAAKMTKSQIMIFVIIAEVIAIVIALYAMNNYLAGKFSRDAYAKRYFVTVANGDVKTAFNMTDAEKSDFINVKTFENYLAQRENLSKVVSYNVARKSDGWVNETTIEYQNDGAQSKNQYCVTLTKGSYKELGIYDSWKISLGDIYASNTKIIVLKGASVTFDGAALDKKYITDDKDDDLADCDVYVIPKMFSGSHQVDVVLDGYNTMNRTFEAPAAEGYVEYFTDMSMTEDYVKSYENIVFENIKTVYTAALNNQSFESLDIAILDENIQEQKEEYEELRSYFNDGDYKVTSVNFENVRISSESNSNYVDVKFNYIIHYKDADGKAQTADGDYWDGTAITNIDGKWVQSDLCASTLTYLWSW